MSSPFGKFTLRQAQGEEWADNLMLSLSKHEETNLMPALLS